jgi:hypothetical protein
VGFSALSAVLVLAALQLLFYSGLLLRLVQETLENVRRDGAL